MSKTIENRKAAKLMESGKNVLEFAATKTFEVLSKTKVHSAMTK